MESTNQGTRIGGIDTKQIENRVREMEKQAEERLRDVKARATQFSEQAADFVRERPGVSLVGAFAVGYLIARIARS